MKYDSDQVTIQTIKKFIDFKDKAVLEIGCGSGKTASLLANNTKKYIGIDPDKTAIETARGLFQNVDFQIGSGESLAFENASFDVVLFTLSLHHQNSQKALSQANRVLKRKGSLLILEPSIHSEFEQFFKLFNDETEVLKESLKNIKNCDFQLEQQKSFDVKAIFTDQDDLHNYHFGRDKITPEDTGRILEKLKQCRPQWTEPDPIELTDTINIFYLTK
ncbi:MAG: class I SAM-dependent methyltransferase [Desulfobacteraceae bacterium]|nr:class I SAM-dependent methyltransferase [Desulfobacteraceae bacterium]